MRSSGSGTSLDELAEVDVELHRVELAPDGVRVGAGQAQVRRDGEVGHERGILEHRREPDPRRLRRRAHAHRLPVDLDRAAVGLDHAGQDLDERALPGAVRAEQRVHLARLDDEVGRAQRDHGAVALGQVTGLQQGFGHERSAARSLRPREREGRPGRPPLALSRSLRPLAGRELSGRVRRPGLDLQPCAVRRRAARRVVRLDVALRAGHRPDERGQLDPVLDLLPSSSLIATAAPAPPIVAGFVTAAACSFGYCASIWCRNSLLSAPTIGTSGLPAVLNALDHGVVGAGVPDAVDLHARVQDVEHLLAGRREVPAHEDRLRRP